MYILSKKKKLAGIIWISIMVCFTMPSLNHQTADYNQDEKKNAASVNEDVVVIGYSLGERKPSIYDGIKKG